MHGQLMAYLDKRTIFELYRIEKSPFAAFYRYVASHTTEEDIIFKRDLDEMQKANKNIRVVYTLTSPDIGKTTWRGRTGYIDDEMIKEEIPDFMERIFYLCGPPTVVKSLMDILK